jgi:hypothetical protein
VNNAAINSQVQVSGWTYAFIPLEYMSWSKVGWVMGFVEFEETAKLLSKMPAQF